VKDTSSLARRQACRETTRSERYLLHMLTDRALAGQWDEEDAHSSGFFRTLSPLSRRRTPC
jgi:hypothetical protein